MSKPGWIPMNRLIEFVAESNAIEGIHRHPTEQEIEAHLTLLGLSEITVKDIEAFVAIVQPGARLRRQQGMNVYVGAHIPPPGGPKIEEELGFFLDQMDISSPHEFHHVYESLHPFTDGNGRSGRALWLYMKKYQQGYDGRRAFLHEWYYESLQSGRHQSSLEKHYG